MLVFEGLIYYLFSKNIIKYLEQLKSINPKTLQTISTFIQLIEAIYLKKTFLMKAMMTFQILKKI